MKILIPASEGKAKISSPSNLKFEDTDFMFEEGIIFDLPSLAGINIFIVFI